ncbi:MAG: hypothetical protein QGH60_18735 [Phycisphaerae bacterium]|jgi:Tfp pilus assembly protein FimT|nr:hypothetical protein [Phycisphaerae bacterium]
MKTSAVGFTLIELLVIIALISLLVMLVIPSFPGVGGFCFKLVM